MLIIDANIKTRPAADHARERPAVAADSAADTSEVEAVTMFAKLDRRLRIHRDIRHQRASGRRFALAKNTAPHPASRSVRADQHTALKIAAFGADSNAVAVLHHLDDAFILDNLESRAHRRPRKHRVEAVAPHDRAEHVAVARQIDAPNRRSRLATHDLHRGRIERNPELLERE